MLIEWDVPDASSQPTAAPITHITLNGITQYDGEESQKGGEEDELRGGCRGRCRLLLLLRLLAAAGLLYRRFSFFLSSSFLLLDILELHPPCTSPNDSSYYYIGKKKKKMGVAVGSNADSTCV